MNSDVLSEDGKGNCGNPDSEEMKTLALRKHVFGGCGNVRDKIGFSSGTCKTKEVVQVEVYVQVDESSVPPQHATLMERISFREVPVGDCRRRCCENLRMCPGSKAQSNISLSGWELEEVGHLELGLVSLGVARRGFVPRMKCHRTLMEPEEAGPCQNESWAVALGTVHR